MYIVAIAWVFVVVLMAAAEATSTQGSLLGAFFVLLLYGALPLSLLLYVMGTPARRRARRRADHDAQEHQAGDTADRAATETAQDRATPSPAPVVPLVAGSAAPDGGGKPAGDVVAAVRKKP